MKRVLFATAVAVLVVLLLGTEAFAAAPSITVLRSPTHPNPRRSYRSHKVTLKWEGSPVSYLAASRGWDDGVIPWAKAEVNDIAVSGTRAYVLASSRGLRIFSVADPARPVEVGHYDGTVGDSEFFLPSRVAVAGTTAYTISGNRLHLLDVRDAAHPSFISSFGIVDPAPSGIGELYDVTVRGKIAYLGGMTAPSSSPFETPALWLITADVSNAANVRLLGFCRLSSWPTRIALQGSYAYVGGGSLSIINVSNPARPRVVSRINDPGRRSLGAPAPAGRNAFAPTEDRVDVFSIASPARPAYRGSFPSSIWPWSKGVMAHLTQVPGTTKKYCLIAYRKPGDLNGFVHVLNASWPLNHDHGELADRGSGDINCVETVGNWVYTGYGSEVRSNFRISHLGPVGYSWVFNKRSRTVPDRRSDGKQKGLSASITVRARSHGVWYFHVRARNKAGRWGSTRRMRVRIR